VDAIAGTRETESVTDIGLGVAIPHARCPGLPGPLVIFGRSREGVLYKGGSGEPVKLFFLLVTPLEQAEAQVILLSQLALFAGNADNRHALLQANSAEEVLTVFRQFSHQS
jgi:mannitol/fructose-specific phosphotransferase system IIA component (Ntr-type)